MYAAPMADGGTHQRFRERWQQHGALAMGLPMWTHMTRYQQFDALTPEEQGLPDELGAMLATSRYGGVGAIWFESAEELAAVMADPDVQVMVADEIETFGRALAESLVPCTPETVIAPREEAAVVLLGQVWRRPELERSEFAERWRDHGRRFAADGDVTRHLSYYVQNHALSDIDGADGFVEIGFPSTAALAAFLVEPAIGGELAEREARFLRPEALELLVCRERQVYDEQSVRTVEAIA
ncbi:MAG: hypothetical protein QOE13_3492 [Gaiellaceae bacterium]|jgi:hypothetical protein|nr:hypothetical protein [Gaiellaceae bacterium]